MKPITGLFTAIIPTIFLSATLVAYDDVEGTGYVVNPTPTRHGIVFTDNYSSRLYLSASGTVDELISSPGCGNYYSLSFDQNFIGFKLIDDNGLQSPALLNVTSKEITRLHSAVVLAGQVSFTNDGGYAFTVGTTLFVVRGTEIVKHDLGVYANLAPISPNGNLAIYNDNNDQLWTIDLSTNERSLISDNKRGYFNPQWASNSAMFLYSSLDGNIFVRDIATNKTYSVGQGYSPSWSNDARRIVFYRKEVDRDRIINADLYLSTFDGSEIVQLTNTPDVAEMDPKMTDGDTQVLFQTYNKKELGVVRVLDKTTIEKREIHLRQPSPLQPHEATGMMGLKKTNQMDLPYVNQVYDTPDWYNGSAACGPTSAIIVVAYYGLLPQWDVWCSASGSSPAHWSHYGNYVCEKYRFRTIDYSYNAQDPNGKSSYGGYGFMWTGSEHPYTRMVSYYYNHGLSASLMDSPPLSFVATEVSAGYPYTLCNGLTTAGHIIVVIGVDEGKHTVTVNDPYGNKNSGVYLSPNGKGVKYDWPSYNNGYQNLNSAFWGVSVRNTALALSDTVVDDLQFDKGFYLNNKAPATMYSWKDMTKGYNGHMWYAYTTWSDSVDTCYAIWQPTLAKAGMYEVSAYIPMATATKAKYKIFYKGGAQTVVINQKGYVDSSAVLGTYEFDKGSTGYIRLGDAAGIKNEAIIFDALMWKYVGPSSPTLTGFEAKLPNSFSLEQNYPNPFNPETRLQFSIPEARFVSLKVFDLLGKEVATLVSENVNPGSYSVKWNAVNYPSGIYFYRLSAGTYTQSKRMLLLK